MFTTLWQWPLNPSIKHNLTEYTVHRKVTPDQNLLSQILGQDQQDGTLRRASIPANVSHWCTSWKTLLWGHRITWLPSPGTSTASSWWYKGTMCSLWELWKQLLDQNPQEVLVSSSLFGIPRAVQEFALAHFKSNMTKTVNDFKCILANLQGEACSNALVETAKEAKEKKRH